LLALLLLSGCQTVTVQEIPCRETPDGRLLFDAQYLPKGSFSDFAIIASRPNGKNDDEWANRLCTLQMRRD
jgi:hypothetical protein